MSDDIIDLAAYVVVDLWDDFSELNDDPDAPFGEIPLLESPDPHTLIVRNQYDPSIGVRITVTSL